MKNMFDVSKTAEEVWETLLGHKFIRQVVSGDWSEMYEMDAAHVFELDNGKFVCIVERGCSCYCYDDASLNVYDTEDEAMKEFNGCKKDSK